MSRTRFLSVDQVFYVSGGAMALADLYAAGDLDLDRRRPLVVREPRLPGTPYFVLDDEDVRTELLRRMEEWDRNSPTLLPEILDVDAAPIVGRQERVPHGVVLADGDFGGVWVTRSTVPDALVPIAAATRRSVRRMRDGVEALGRAQVGPVGAGRGDGGDGDESPDDSAGKDAVIRRSPHLEAPDELPEPGSTFGVKVWTDSAEPHVGEESVDVVVEAPPSVRTVDLEVVLMTSSHLETVKSSVRPLTIERDREDSCPATFTVRVNNVDDDGPATLLAQFLYRGRPSGSVRKRWTWPARMLDVGISAGVGGPAIHTDSVRPDLTVLIKDVGTGFQCSVLGGAFGSVNPYAQPVQWNGLGDHASQFVTDSLGDFVDPQKSSAARREALLVAGNTFWNAAPQQFRNALWELIDIRAKQRHTKRATIFVASDEPLLPWEIMRPSRPVAGEPDEERPQPLGVEFNVGRWVRALNDAAPPPTLPVRDSFLIAARYKPGRALDPTMEFDALRPFGATQVSPATREYLTPYLAEHSASLIHFVCHGAATAKDMLIYLDDDEELASSVLRVDSGFKAACAARKPIIFLNACDAGQSQRTLGPGGVGFPAAFTSLGARAVIAPLWPVTKGAAPLVAKKIYTIAAKQPGRPLSDILAELRARSYADANAFDDSWAAYCLFGDPNGKLTRIQ